MTQTTRVPWDHKPSREEIDAFALAHGIPEHLTCYVMALPQRKNVGTKSDPKWETDYRPYMGVDGRLMQAHGTAPEEMSILTEILPSPEGLIIMRATVTVNNRTFQGHAASRLSGASSAEGTNPLEVAETSAVGRALGMAGYGLLPGSGIASYEEVRNAQNAQSQPQSRRTPKPEQPPVDDDKYRQSNVKYECPSCLQVSVKYVPAGEKEGKKYNAFWICQNPDCTGDPKETGNSWRSWNYAKDAAELFNKEKQAA